MQLSLAEILVLAVVQGVAEFLPVSSSGHIVVLSHWMQERGNKPPDIGDLNIVLHIGTLFSILVFYHRRIWRLLTTERRVIGMLILATIPAVVVGLPIKKFCEHILENPWIAGALFPVTGRPAVSVLQTGGECGISPDNCPPGNLDRHQSGRGDSAGPVAERFDHCHGRWGRPDPQLGSCVLVSDGHSGHRGGGTAGSH